MGVVNNTAAASKCAAVLLVSGQELTKFAALQQLVISIFDKVVTEDGIIPRVQIGLRVCADVCR